MSIETLLDALKQENGPDRVLDTEISVLIGYRKIVDEADAGAPKVSWLHHSGKGRANIPRYTAYIQHARGLAELVAPQHGGACRWDESGGGARINDEPVSMASSPAIALCLAALNHRQHFP
ncbi:hypothetical protein [Neorhizobium petrolearium]|uniref:DUF2591 domain-containing protein n=1 Tax=Neorhizobium petrolearium TaxID=515361 RepID=A0ABY8M4P1_9HYPH|nr:hypothetical protein [Neorhizobium petrolearium]MCC2608401.1 hypothetical protein [Neorhizobium petrolearium]WGI68679.1 hypothetical protein QEO92_00835 [Neorhizobium petrolearium]